MKHDTRSLLEVCTPWTCPLARWICGNLSLAGNMFTRNHVFFWFWPPKDWAFLYLMYQFFLLNHSNASNLWRLWRKNMFFSLEYREIRWVMGEYTTVTHQMGIISFLNSPQCVYLVKEISGTRKRSEELQLFPFGDNFLMILDYAFIGLEIWILQFSGPKMHSPDGFGYRKFIRKRWIRSLYGSFRTRQIDSTWNLNNGVPDHVDIAAVSMLDKKGVYQNFNIYPPAD